MYVSKYDWLTTDVTCNNNGYLLRVKAAVVKSMENN